MSAPVVAVLVVPHGTRRPEPLAGALRDLHPDWEVGAVWCGDPQLRPRLDGLAWLDNSDLAGAGEVDVIAGDRSVGEWKRAVAVATELLDRGAETIVLLWVGAIAVLSPIDALVAPTSAPVTLLPRSVVALPDDGLIPNEHDLSAAGLFSTTVAVLRASARPALEWIAANLGAAEHAGRVLERAAQLFDAAVCTDAASGVGKWRWGVGDPALLDVDDHDARSPWTLDAHAGGPMRIELLGHPDRQATMERAAPQLAGEVTALCLPGGIEVDDSIRRLVATSGRAVPSPWSEPARFRNWLAQSYWRDLHETRPDLWTAFPDPEGRSASEFRRWSRAAFTFGDAPFLLPAPVLERQPVSVADDVRHDGLNLVGYFRSELGLGDVVRRLRAACDAAGLAHSEIATHRTTSPQVDAGPLSNRIEFAASLCVVTADQFPYLATDFPELFARTQRMIGYWFWELEHIPLHMRQAIALVDEIWAGSQFVTNAFAAVSPVPVRHVPIPVVEPLPSSRGRAEFAEVAGVGERPLFLCTLDHLSVTERKNPVGVIEAFRRAFTPGEGPVLVVKTMNGRLRWPHHQRVLAAADGRDDIIVWDEALDRADQMALVAAADCMVSLHRSEGLGLHLAESMWLGTPVIATRYSGNLDFMTDDNSLLIDADLVNVENGERVYPPAAKWAAPDLDAAAAAMHRIVGDAQLASRLAEAGRKTMERQPTLADTGRLIRRLVLGEG